MSGFLGILMLDTAFPRILGDVGNQDSYPFPVKTKIVDGAGALEIVRDARPHPDLINRFMESAAELEAQGAVSLISTCGFLVSVQHDIARAVNIPVMTSALSILPLVRQLHGNRPIGVLTASSSSLQELALSASGVSRNDIRVSGLEDVPVFRDAILTAKSQQPDYLDVQAIKQAVIAKAKDLQAQTPNLAAFVLECANLPPYADAIKQETGLPVYHLIDAATLLWNSAGSRSK